MIGAVAAAGVVAMTLANIVAARYAARQRGALGAARARHTKALRDGRILDAHLALIAERAETAWSDAVAFELAGRAEVDVEEVFEHLDRLAARQ